MVFLRLRPVAMAACHVSKWVCSLSARLLRRVKPDVCKCLKYKPITLQSTSNDENWALLMLGNKIPIVST